MKTIIRLLIILLAAVVVTGVTWAMGQSGGSTTQTAFGRGERGEFSAPSAGRAGREGGDFHPAQFTSLRGWLGFTETLVPIAMIITLVTLPASLWNATVEPVRTLPPHSPPTISHRRLRDRRRW